MAETILKARQIGEVLFDCPERHRSNWSTSPTLDSRWTPTVGVIGRELLVGFACTSWRQCRPRRARNLGCATRKTRLKVSGDDYRALDGGPCHALDGVLLSQLQG